MSEYSLPKLIKNQRKRTNKRIKKINTNQNWKLHPTKGWRFWRKLV